jgi:hypothetical protein
MPRGGARPGAGRKRAPRVKLEPASPENETPLEYMLKVMRDGSATPARRDAMAVRALPYVHHRNPVPPESPTKSDWGDLLAVPPAPPAYRLKEVDDER